MKTPSMAILAMMAGVYASGTAARVNTIEGAISGFECGDNCYLTVTDASGQARTGLCAALLCREWNEGTAMPARFMGQKVRITVGTGKQYDGEGNVAGETDSFDKIELLRKTQ